jgi:hypothetical protein
VSYYVGIDAGPSTGVVVLSVELRSYEWSVFQCNGEAAFWLIQTIYDRFCPRMVAIEKFIPSNRAGGTGKDAELTRRIAHFASDTAISIRRNPATFVRARSAAEVKPWATDKRLEKSGFPLGAKFKDARDAGRHALFAAVQDGKETDPLARAKWN